MMQSGMVKGENMQSFAEGRNSGSFSSLSVTFHQSFARFASPIDHSSPELTVYNVVIHFLSNRFVWVFRFKMRFVAPLASKLQLVDLTKEIRQTSVWWLWDFLDRKDY